MVEVYAVEGASGAPALLYSPPMTLAPAPRVGPSRDYRAEFPIFRRSELPQHLLARSAVAAVAAPGERVPRPLGVPRRRGMVRRVVGGAGRAPRALRAARRRAGGDDRTPPEHLQPRSPRWPSRSTTAAGPRWSCRASTSPPSPISGSPSPGEVEVEIVREPGRRVGAARGVRARGRRPDRDRRHEPRVLHQRRDSGPRRRSPEIAHRRGALLLVDGYQAAGQLPVDVRDLDVDFYCAGGLKWLLGGSGVAFLYARPSCSPVLAPRATGWFASGTSSASIPGRWCWQDDARRLEAGTPSHPLGLRAARRPRRHRGAGRRARSAAAPWSLTEDLIDCRPRGRARVPRSRRPRPSGARSSCLPSDDPARDVRRLAAATYRGRRAARDTCASLPTSTTSRTTAEPRSSA